MNPSKLRAALVGTSLLLAGGSAVALLTPAQAGPPASLPQLATQSPNLVSDVAEHAVEAVVHISTESSVQLNRGFGNPLFERFFGPDAGPHGQNAEPLHQRSEGSGVLVEADGLVLTNAHVVADADEIAVKLHDGREFQGKVLGVDRRSDLAVLQLDGEPKGLPTLKVGDSSILRLGEMVLAVGNPFGLSGTVTLGIVSAKDRSGLGIADYEDFIQTDAAINPGNSGGALVNLKGELVGINTAIASRSGGYQGIGFAIPSNMALRITDDLRDDGTVARGFLGIGIQDLDVRMAAAFDTDADGVLVSQINPDSPGDKAGLRPGDVITAVGGVATPSANRLRNLVADTAPGTKVKLSVLRDGKPRTLKATLGERPGEQVASRGAGDDAMEALQGLTVAPVSDGVRARYRVPDDVHTGLVVTDVAGAARHAGVRPGDVIIEANHQRVKDLAGLKDAAAGQDGLLLLLRRGEGSVYLMVE